MRMIVVSLAAGFALGACAPTTTATARETGGAMPEPQRCDADTVGRELIGSHRGAVDFAPGADVRVVCTTCPTTRDYRPDRLNVHFNEATGIIESVDCG